jgi:hypothetical protein
VRAYSTLVLLITEFCSFLLHLQEHEGYEEADQKADEWRAREIAKLIAKRKMEKMKEVAEKKAKEERARLEEELEMVLMVEKLQELRALRIQKLKKQGNFFDFIYFFSLKSCAFSSSLILLFPLQAGSSQMRMTSSWSVSVRQWRRKNGRLLQHLTLMQLQLP